jgi:hypothetical protein
MTQTIEQINNEGRELFGSYDFETEVEALPAYMERLKKQGEEMDRFIESLPNFVPDTEYFNLYLMTDAERADWLKSNAPKEVPMERSPYFSAKIGYAQNAKLEKCGNINVR